jgi:hypothetical protein
MAHCSDDDPFSDDAYHRLQAGGLSQRDRVLQTWRQNNPRHIPLEQGPTILDLITEREPAERRTGGFTETSLADKVQNVPARGSELAPKATEASERPAARVCACGCERPLNRSNQKFASTRCRQRHWVAQKRRKQSTKG